jgi:hypothetical protein
MEKIEYEAILGMMSEMNRKLDAIQANGKAKESRVEILPTQETISLETLMKLFPKPRIVIIGGFEFLRTSVVIFVLAVVLFWSLAMNIKQMDERRILKIRLEQQTEYLHYLQQEKEEKKE